MNSLADQKLTWNKVCVHLMFKTLWQAALPPQLNKTGISKVCHHAVAFGLFGAWLHDHWHNLVTADAVQCMVVILMQVTLLQAVGILPQHLVNLLQIGTVHVRRL